MTDTHHLGLPYIAASQAQKHVTHNEALRILDAVVMLAVDDRDLSAPPGSPAEGGRYLVKPTGTGAFSGKDGQIAYYRDGAFAFLTPRVGWLAYVIDEETLLVHDGEAWTALSGAADLQDVELFGLATEADETNPFSARLNNALFTAREVADGGDGDLRAKFSKETAGDTVSLLLQTGLSGRAEIGLTGDDDLHLKVSTDGSTWREGLVITAATGKVSFPQGATGLREKLSANRTYYVRTDGSDSNTGLANTSGGAFQTIQKAWDTLVTLDLGGFAVTIQLADGTYTAGLNAGVSPVGGSVVLTGNTSTPANVIIATTSASCVTLGCAASLTVNGCELRTTTSGNGLFSATAGAVIRAGTNMRFGACVNAHMVSANGGRIQTSAAYDIVGAAQSHIRCEAGATFLTSGITVTVTGTLNFSVAFVYCLTCSVVTTAGNTYSGGTVTGLRYSAASNGVINTFGSGGSYFPGGSSGTTATGGQYI